MTKVQKTIFGYQIKSFNFLKTYNYRLRKNVITGIIWLENSKRIKIENGKYFLINNSEEVEGILLKSNPGWKRIKRIIARWFSSYRNNVREAIETMRESCQQAQYNLRIKQIQTGRISYNHYYTAS